MGEFVGNIGNIVQNELDCHMEYRPNAPPQMAPLLAPQNSFINFKILVFMQGSIRALSISGFSGQFKCSRRRKQTLLVCLVDDYDSLIDIVLCF